MEHDLNVRKIREAKNMTQAQFAAALGVDQATVSNWETGKNRPSGPARRIIRELADGARAA